MEVKFSVTLKQETGSSQNAKVRVDIDIIPHGSVRYNIYVYGVEWDNYPWHVCTVRVRPILVSHQSVMSINIWREVHYHYSL